MMKIKIKLGMLAMLGFLCVTLPSCKKWLAIEPLDRSTEDRLFKDESGFKTALNGIYLEMTNDKAYGADLSMKFVDILAQYYNVNPEHRYTKLATYAYQEEPTKSNIQSIWNTAYSQIANCNVLIDNADKRKAVFTADNYSLIKGEALALRACFHFDMLRLFGPVYAKDPNALSIPYYDQKTNSPNPILKASEVMEKVLLDLVAAEQLLLNDPIITKGPMFSEAVDGTGADLRYRNLRMNYFAVKALHARVALYAGQKSEALQLADEVITKATKWFPFISVDQIMTDNINPNRVLSTEVLFALQSPKLNTVFKGLFAPELDAKTILAPTEAKLAAVFENNENDYRYTPIWIKTGVGGKNYRIFYKYDDIEDKRRLYRNLIPMFRLSEMYYIAAETSSNVNQGLVYLNKIRNARGLTDLTITEVGNDLQSRIEKEYVREFYGEGQLFYYYKRVAKTVIPSGYGSNPISMSKVQYVLPLPESETKYRN